jgi:hypothetical protein
MIVDSSVDLGRDDPALEFPWASDDGSIHYIDLKNAPTLIDDIPEAQKYCELRDFLVRVNAPEFALQSAKSDVWITDEILPEEEIFAAPQKLVSYVDLIFSTVELRLSLDPHLELVNKLCTLMRQAPDMPASMEFIIRHCYYHEVPRAPAGQHDLSPDLCDAAVGNVPDPNNSSVQESADGAEHGTFQCSEQGTPTHPDAGASIENPGLDHNLRCGFSITVYVSGFGQTEQEARQGWSIALRLLQHALVQVVRSG